MKTIFAIVIFTLTCTGCSNMGERKQQISMIGATVGLTYAVKQAMKKNDKLRPYVMELSSILGDSRSTDPTILENNVSNFLETSKNKGVKLGLLSGVATQAIKMYRNNYTKYKSEKGQEYFSSMLSSFSKAIAIGARQT